MRIHSESSVVKLCPGMHRLHEEAGQPNKTDVLRASVADPRGSQEDV